MICTRFVPRGGPNTLGLCKPPSCVCAAAERRQNLLKKFRKKTRVADSFLQEKGLFWCRRGQLS